MSRHRHDASGNANVTGMSTSSDTHVFITELTFSAGNLSQVYSSSLAGSKTDVAEGIAVDGTGRASVTGYTNSPNFPILNSIQSTFFGSPSTNTHAFVARLSATVRSRTRRSWRAPATTMGAESPWTPPAISTSSARRRRRISRPQAASGEETRASPMGSSLRSTLRAPRLLVLAAWRAHRHGLASRQSPHGGSGQRPLGG